MTITELKKLIAETHKHGVQLGAEIRVLEGKRTAAARAKILILRVRLRGLEALNKRRRKELKKLEQKKPAPKPKPTPKPAPKPVPPKPKPAPKPLLFVMYDAVTIGNIPDNPGAVAGYVNGKWPTYQALVARFPHAKHLSIAVSSNADADFLDVEKGDATVADIAGWVKRQKERGLVRPGIYGSLSIIPAILEALKAAGIKREEVRIWSADYTYVPHITPGADATQWTNKALGRDLDQSLCHADFL